MGLEIGRAAYREDLFLHELPALVIDVLLRVVAHGEVDVLDRPRRFAADELKAQIDARKAFLETAEPGHEPVGCEGRGKGERDGSLVAMLRTDVLERDLDTLKPAGDRVVELAAVLGQLDARGTDRKSTRLNSSH